MPVVQVKMSDECHKALKQWSAFLGVPMGELLYRYARFGFHEQAHCCSWMDGTLSYLGIELDKGSEKPCFGFRCNICSKRTECRTGVYQGLVEIPEQIQPTVTAHGKAVIGEMRKAWPSHKKQCSSSHCNEAHP